MRTPNSTGIDTLSVEVDTRIEQPRLGQMLVCSLVVGKPTSDQLQTLAEQSSHNNRNRGLSGVLLCGNGVFVHWLEGLESYLQEAWTSIARDIRHSNVVVVWQNKEAPERLFGDWNMGLRSTLVAQDLLAMLHIVKQQRNAKTMLNQGYYEVFSEAFNLLERICGPKTSAHHLSPARGVLAAMKRYPFTPVVVASPEHTGRDARPSELTSLTNDASSIFKNSIPFEHTALFDRAAEGADDLLTLLDRPLRWAIGKDLWALRTTLSDRPLHWTYEDKLVVVFDHRTWRLGMHPELTSIAYEQACMVERLPSANDIPTVFRQTTAYALLWDFAVSARSTDLKLPTRFKHGRIRLRRPPPVPEHMLSIEQQHLLALLGKGPERLVDLAHSMQLQVDAAANLLRPLYATRCIEALGK